MIPMKLKWLISRKAVRHPHARVGRWYRLHMLVVWRAFVWVSGDGHLFLINESFWKMKMLLYMLLVVSLILLNLGSTRHNGGGGRTEVDALPPILQRTFWGEVFCYNAESVFSCSFILCRIFDMSNECPWWMTLPWQPSNYMYVMHKIDSFGITLYSRHNWSMINDQWHQWVIHG